MNKLYCLTFVSYLYGYENEQLWHFGLGLGNEFGSVTFSFQRSLDTRYYIHYLTFLLIAEQDTAKVCTRNPNKPY